MASCVKDPSLNPLSTDAEIVGEDIIVPKGFPPIEYPEDNPYSLEKWELGKKLFYDPALSIDFSTSCASCHNPELAFSDDSRVSKGADNNVGIRNSPSLANVAYLPYFTREGEVPTLEQQILVPIQEHAEFNFNIVALSERLKTNKEYQEMSRKAFDREIDAYVITRAIASFERSLVSGSSPFDQYTFQGKEKALTEQQVRGLRLFYSERTQCGTCHSGFLITDHRIANNGLYAQYEDPGRYRLTFDSADYGHFKVPSLRNVALTAPYMHDGSIETLEGVIEHYNQGGKRGRFQDSLIRPLNLKDEEKEALLAFLLALTDRSFVENPRLRE